MATMMELVERPVWDEAAALRWLEENQICFEGTDLMYRLLSLPYNKERAAFVCAHWPEAMHVLKVECGNFTPVTTAAHNDNVDMLRHFIEFDSRTIEFYHRTRRSLLTVATEPSIRQPIKVFRYLLTEQIEAFESNGDIFSLLTRIHQLPGRFLAIVKECVFSRFFLPVYRTPAVWDAFHGTNPTREHNCNTCAQMVTALYESQDGCQHMKKPNFVDICRRAFETLFMLEHAAGGARCYGLALKFAKLATRKDVELCDRIAWIAQTTGDRYLKTRDSTGANVVHYLVYQPPKTAICVITIIAHICPSLLFERDHRRLLPIDVIPQGERKRKAVAALMLAHPRELMSRLPSSSTFLEDFTGRTEQLLPHAETDEDFLWILRMTVTSISDWTLVARRYTPIFFEKGACGRNFLFMAFQSEDIKHVLAYVKAIQCIAPITLAPLRSCVPIAHASNVYASLAQVPRCAESWKKYIGPTSMLFMMFQAQFY